VGGFTYIISMLEKDMEVCIGECRKTNQCRGRDNGRKVDAKECDVEE